MDTQTQDETMARSHKLFPDTFDKSASAHVALSQCTIFDGKATDGIHGLRAGAAREVYAFINDAHPQYDLTGVKRPKVSIYQAGSTFKDIAGILKCFIDTMIVGVNPGVKEGRLATFVLDGFLLRTLGFDGTESSYVETPVEITFDWRYRFKPDITIKFGDKLKIVERDTFAISLLAGLFATI